MQIHKSACKLTVSAEIHFPARISACGNTPKMEYFRTLENSQIFGVFPHAEMHDLM